MEVLLLLRGPVVCLACHDQRLARGGKVIQSQDRAVRRVVVVPAPRDGTEMRARECCHCITTIGGYRRGLIGPRRRGFGRPDIEAGQCELSQKANLCKTIDSDENPLAVNFSVLKSDVKVREPKGGTFSRHSLDLANAESAFIDPNLPTQKEFISPLGKDRKNVLGNFTEVLLPNQNKVVVFPVDR